MKNKALMKILAYSFYAMISGGVMACIGVLTDSVVEPIGLLLMLLGFSAAELTVIAMIMKDISDEDI